MGKVKGRVSLALFGILLLLILAACGTGGGEATGTEFTLQLSEYKFSPGTIRVQAGQEIRVTLKNVGQKDHEWMVGRGMKEMEGAPAGFEEDFFHEVQVKAFRDGQEVDPESLMGEGMEMGGMGGEDHGFMVRLSPGEEVTLVFTVPEEAAGEWTMGCFEDDGQHFEEGMKGKFIVER